MPRLLRINAFNTSVRSILQRLFSPAAAPVRHTSTVRYIILPGFTGTGRICLFFPKKSTITPIVSATAVLITDAHATPASPMPALRKTSRKITSINPMTRKMTMAGFALPSSLRKLNGKYISVVRNPNSSMILA